MRLTALLLFAMLLVAALAAETVNLSERNRRGWFKKTFTKLKPKKTGKSFLDILGSFTSKAEGLANSVAATQQVVDNVSSLANVLGLKKNTDTFQETSPETSPETTPEK